MPTEESNDSNPEEILTEQLKSRFPTTLADLRLNSLSAPDYGASTSQESIYKTIGRLRKSTLSIPNRLRSVLEDANFVEALWNYLTTSCPVDSNFPPPSETCDEEGEAIKGTTANVWALIPNERSGSWPLDPSLKLQSQCGYLSSQLPHKTSTPIDTLSQSSASPPLQTPHQPVSAYFKSTDGHINQWSFSLRRLNLPVLSLLGYSQGAILIDTTRRGKTYPDALRRTTPIYICVWNHVLFPELVSTGVCDFQPYNIDASEVVQIKARITRFVADLEGLGLDLERIRDETKRPTRCIWVAAPAGGSDELDVTFDALVEDIKEELNRWKNTSGVDGVNILVCCSASRKVIGAEMSEDGYIQGSGDDSEGWSCGLSANMFWDNKEELTAAMKGGGDMEELVKTLVQKSKSAGVLSSAVLIQPTSNLFLSSDKSTQSDFDLIISCNESIGAEPDAKVLSLACKEGKLGSKMLRDKLAVVKQKVQAILQKDPSAQILVTCSTGKDLSVGVVLTLLCIFYSDTGFINLNQTHTIDKQFIKQRLAWISSVKADASPSRATLQAVNSFLMDRPA